MQERYLVVPLSNGQAFAECDLFRIDFSMVKGVAGASGVRVTRY